jgi:ubiquinone/menaquinone biosynthesis C-methylase UbiE
MKNYQYIETSKTLNSRINFNKKYGNFDLYKFIDRSFEIKAGQSVVDFGCGDGRYTGLFSKKIKSQGSLFCIDKNTNLIKKIKNKYKKYKNIKILCKDFDSNWKIENKIDWFFSIYSIQYTKNFDALLNKIKKILSKNAGLVFIGPGKQNATKLYKIHNLIFNKPVPSLYVERMNFIEKKVYPALKQNIIKKKIIKKKHNYIINFPSPYHYAEYYWSTPLWTDQEAKMQKKDIITKKMKSIELIKKYKLKFLEKQTISVYCR